MILEVVLCFEYVFKYTRTRSVFLPPPNPTATGAGAFGARADPLPDRHVPQLLPVRAFHPHHPHMAAHRFDPAVQSGSVVRLRV